VIEGEVYSNNTGDTIIMLAGKNILRWKSISPREIIIHLGSTASGVFVVYKDEVAFIRRIDIPARGLQRRK
jgi:hypothetical protein